MHPYSALSRGPCVRPIIATAEMSFPVWAGLATRRLSTASETSGAFHSGSSAPSSGFAESWRSRTADGAGLLESRQRYR
jgi:hypothetical protein